MMENNNSLGRWISLLYRYGRIYIGKQLKIYGIGKGQYIFLNALYKKDGISQEELSSYLKIDKGTTAKAIKKLQEEGYVIRKDDVQDRRAYKVFLTDKAMEVKDVVRKTLEDWTDILCIDFTEEEKELALKIMSRMGKNASAYTSGYLDEEE